MATALGAFDFDHAVRVVGEGVVGAHQEFALFVTERPRGCCLTRPFLGALLSKCPEAEEHLALVHTRARRGASDHRKVIRSEPEPARRRDGGEREHYNQSIITHESSASRERVNRVERGPLTAKV